MLSTSSRNTQSADADVNDNDLIPTPDKPDVVLEIDELDTTANTPHIEPPVSDEPPDNSPKKPEKKAPPISHRLFLLIPIAAATLQASQSVMDLQKSRAPFELQVIIPVLSFINSIGLSKKFTISSIDKIIRLKNTGNLPKSWSKLSRGKEILAVTVAGTITAYIVISNAFQSYDYIDTFPRYYRIENNINPHAWMALNVVISSTIGINIILSQGWELYDTLRERIAFKPIKFTNSLSLYGNMLIGTPLCLLSAAYTYFSSNDAMRDYFALTDIPAKCVIGTLSITNALGDYCMNGRYSIQTIDKLIAYLAANRPTAAETLAAVTSGTFSGFLNYNLRPINEAALKFILDELIDAPGVNPTLAAALSWGLAINYVINDTASMSPLLKIAFSWAGSHLSNAYHYLTDKCRAEEASPEEERPLLAQDRGSIQAPSPALPYTNNPNRLFQPAPATQAESKFPEERARCAIL